MKISHMNDFVPTKQTLRCGIKISQDIREAVRFVLYETGYTDWEYATDGGTAFVISYRGSYYAITAKHVLKNFDWKTLVITDLKRGNQVAGFNAIFYPSSLRLAAQESDIGDIVVVKLSDTCKSQFFNNTAYVVDEGTITKSQKKDPLMVEGSLKQLSEITDTEIKARFCTFYFIDDGNYKADPILRKAYATYPENTEFTTIAGISGSPVFNVLRNGLCGMVLRGTMSNKSCKIYYLDIFDIVKILEAIDTGRLEARYLKPILP